MKEEFTSNQFENDGPTLNTHDIDYKNLITKLKEIKKTIALIEKMIFR